MAEQQRKPREPRTFWYTLARVLLFLLSPIFFPVKYHHKQRINNMDAPYIIASNHVSMLDPPLLPLPIKRYEVRFMGKRELVKSPILAYLLGKLHMIAVSRHMTDMGAMRAANEVLKQGHVLAIFPEGTRKPQNQLMQDLETGVSLIALKNKVPVMPVYIHGKPGMFRRVHIYYLPPLDYQHLLERGLGKDVVEDMTRLLADVILAARDSVEKTGDLPAMEA